MPHSYNTRYQAKLRQEHVAWRVVNVPMSGLWTYRNKDVCRVSKKIKQIINEPEGDMAKLMKYVDKNPYILVVHQDTCKTIQWVINDYTPKHAEYGRILTNLHSKSKKDSPEWEEVREEMVQWLILKNLMESVESICKA